MNATMTPDQARKLAREIYQSVDQSCPDYSRRTIILRKLVAQGCDPGFAATAAGFEVSAQPPAWLADLVVAAE